MSLRAPLCYELLSLLREITSESIQCLRNFLQLLYRIVDVAAVAVVFFKISDRHPQERIASLAISNQLINTLKDFEHLSTERLPRHPFQHTPSA